MKHLKHFALTVLFAFIGVAASFADNTDWLIFSSGQNGTVVKSVLFQNKGRLYFDSGAMRYVDSNGSTEISYDGGSFMYFSDKSQDATGGEENQDPEPSTTGMQLFIENQNVYKDKVNLLPICLTNESDVTALNFDITLPYGLSVKTDEWGDYDIQLAGRNDATFNIGTSDVDGNIRVVCYSAKNRTFAGNEGAILFLPVIVDNNVEIGSNLKLSISNIGITKIEDGDMDEVNAPNSTTELTVVPSYTLGDVNNDGKFTSIDISMAVAYVLGRTPAKAIPEAADMNKDGKYTSIDISLVVSYVLYGGPTSSSKAPIRKTAVSKNNDDEEYATELVVERCNTNSFKIGVPNINEFVSGQFDLVLSDGVDVSDIRLSESYGEHDVVYNRINEGIVRVVIFSPSNKHFNPNENIEIVLNGAENGRVDVGDILLVSEDNLAFSEIQATGVSLNIGANDLTSVGANATSDVVYTISGQRVNDFKMAGIYIKNNKKVIVK